MEAMMNKHPKTARSRTPLLFSLALLTAVLVSLTETPIPAFAGTYPMYQCSPGSEAVAPGWSVFGVNTLTSTVLWNTCSTGGAIGDYVASNEQAGAVTENGHSGSQVGLQVEVPASSPGVTIRSIAGQITGSSATGDDAFMGFTSDGQTLPGGVELPYGGANYTTSENWSLPQGARDFEASVTCTTDHSSTTCAFADSIAVPALSNITLTLQDNTPPTIGSTSGSLSTTATHDSTVIGTQTFGFAGSDADSGVRSATLKLTPQNGETPYTHTFDFSDECTYISWNACPLKQNVSDFSINTAALKDDNYTTSLSVTDAAGNTTSNQLGTITTHNAPTNTSTPTILVPGEALAGSELATHPGTWTAPSGAGTTIYAYQWEQCDTQANNCQLISNAQNPSYTPTPADIGHTLRLIVNASDNDGSTQAVSAPTNTIPSQQGSPAAQPGPETTKNSNPTPSSAPTISDGTPNGTITSGSPTIHLGVPHTISRPFAHSALTIPGRLLDNHGDPIASAQLDVIQRTAGTTRLRVIGHTQTGTNGTFLAYIPPGPSRLLQLAYRASSTDTQYTTTNNILESVKASVRLMIEPHQTDRRGTITLTGQVLGPVPRHGTIVDLLVHYRGHWEPFKTPQTDAHGHFKTNYKFQDGLGHFPFRAKVPTGQAGYPFATGYSKVVNITTN